MDELAAIGRIFLGLVFLAAGLRKLQNRSDFREAITGNPLLGPALTPLVYKVLPPAELVLGSILLVGVPSHDFALATAVTVLAGFLAFQLVVVRAGADVDCGCFGSREKVGISTIVRNVVLLLIAIGALVHSSRSGWVGTSTPLPLLLAALMIFVVATLAIQGRRMKGVAVAAIRKLEAL